ncbi:hypothetical protein TNCV_1490391 [Trichonephila clavipes]|nr:hypothetical protein TNCV_1490391 [Trichonephila clavipes]
MTFVLCGTEKGFPLEQQISTRKGEDHSTVQVQMSAGVHFACEGQGLLCPTQYTQPWAPRCMSRCSDQVVSLTRNPSVEFPSKLSTHIDPLKG